MSFTLVQTPRAYGLPTAQPSCLEALLYLKHVNKSPHGIVLDNASNLIAFHDNKYWSNKMDAQHRDITTLPILHHKHAIVPTNNIIPYLKDNFYNIDEYMSLNEAVVLDAFRIYANRLISAVQFILVQDSSYPIAEGVFWGIRWWVRAEYTAAVTSQATSANIFTLEEATMEVSYMLANLALKLGDANYFGPQGKLSSLDFTVCAAVSFCIFTETQFLTQLLYQYYPTLVRHCQTVLTTVLESDHQLEVMTERLTAQIRKDALSSLFGSSIDQLSAQNASFTHAKSKGDISISTKHTPEKKKKKKTTRATYDDDYDLGGDDDYNTPLDIDTELLDDPNDPVSLDDGLADSTSSNNADRKSLRASLAASKNPDGMNSEQEINKMLYPSTEQVYINRHLFPEGSTQQARVYAVQAFLLTTAWMNEQVEPPGSWAQQFLFFGAATMVMYFIIVQAKKEGDIAYDAAKVAADKEDFHRLETPLIDNYPPRKDYTKDTFFKK